MGTAYLDTDYVQIDK